MNICLHSADNGFPSYSRTCRCSPPISHRRAARHSGAQILERLLVFKLWTIVHNSTSIHSVSWPQNCPFCYISVPNCTICEHGYVQVHDIYWIVWISQCSRIADYERRNLLQLFSMRGPWTTMSGEKKKTVNTCVVSKSEKIWGICFLGRPRLA